MNMSFLKEKGNKYLIILGVCALGLLLLLPTSEKEDGKKTEGVSVDFSATDLELRLKHVLSSMEGVGEVEIMVTQEEKTSYFWNSKEEETIGGVVVVCEGAGNPVVEKRISDAIQALFPIEAHKISIIKKARQED